MSKLTRIGTNPSKLHYRSLKITSTPNVTLNRYRETKVNNSTYLQIRNFNIPTKLIQTLLMNRFLSKYRMLSPFSTFKFGLSGIVLIGSLFLYPTAFLGILGLGSAYFVYKGIRLARTVKGVLNSFNGLNPNSINKAGIASIFNEIFPNLSFDGAGGMDPKLIDKLYNKAVRCIDLNVKQDLSIGIRQLSSELPGIDLETQLVYQKPHNTIFKTVQLDGRADNLVGLEFLAFVGNYQLLFKIEGRVLGNGNNPDSNVEVEDEVELIQVKAVLLDTWQEFVLDSKVDDPKGMNFNKQKVKVAEFREIK